MMSAEGPEVHMPDVRNATLNEEMNELLCDASRWTGVATENGADAKQC
jgi:hypothetical protein